MELGYLIDRIKCSKDGTILVRICRFGLASELGPFLREKKGGHVEPLLSKDESGQQRRLGTPRRRSIRRVDDREAARFVAEPDRFAGIPDEWFWVETLQQSRRQSWSEANADKVYAMRFATDGSVKATLKELEAQLNVSRPTLRKAIEIGRDRQRQGERDADGDAA